MDVVAKRHLEALFLSGTTHGRYEDLKDAVNNGHILGDKPMPVTYKRVFWMAEDFQTKKVRELPKEDPGVGMLYCFNPECIFMK